MKRILPWAGVAIICLILGFVFGTLWAVNSARSAAFILGSLALGVVLGFIIAWLLEESYRRNQELEQQIEAMRQTPASPIQPPLAISGENEEIASQTLATFLQQRDVEAKQLRLQIDETEEKLLKLNANFETYVQSHPDDMTTIKGIGPVYHWKLRDIGVSSFHQLAEADPAQLRRMLEVKNWQRVDIESWIAQARDWASQNE